MMTAPAAPPSPMPRPMLVLASSSPRRRALLAQIGFVPARIAVPDIDESARAGELPRDYARRMAREKLDAVPADPGAVVLAGDTVFAAGRRILPRAADAGEVAACLKLLSGRRHRVFSAIAVRGADGRVRERLSETVLRFRRLDDAAIAEYARSGEGEGKAGGYAIQGRAAAFVLNLAGSYSGVVGLPLAETAALLVAAGLKPDAG